MKVHIIQIEITISISNTKIQNNFMFGCDFNYFDELNNLLNDPNTPIPIIFNVENFRGAFRKENTKLCQYILLHITDVVDFAFGLIKDEENSVKIQSNALYILTTQTSSFSKQLTTHRTYLLKLMSFIKNEEPIDKYILTTFCFIFQFMIKLTNGFIFIHLPEKDKFISRLASHIIHNSIYDFLIFLSTSQNQVVIDYLTNSQAVLKLLSSIGNQSKSSTPNMINKRKFNILSNIVKNSKASFLPDEISIRSTLEFIIKYSISEQCSSSFIFLSNMWDFYQYKKVSISLPQIIKSMSDDFVDFILNDTQPFNHSKNIALSLLSRTISSEKFLTEKIIEMAEKLWDLFFDNPSYSMLHEALLNFIKSAISADQKIIEKVEIREKIVKAYSERKTVTATYWGHLHLMTALIIKVTEQKVHSKSQSSTQLKNLPEFDKYVNSFFIPIEMSLENGYGGKLPKRPNLTYNDSQHPFCPSASPYGQCNSSILNYIKHRFHNIKGSRTQISDDNEEEEEDKNEEESSSNTKSENDENDTDSDNNNKNSKDDDDDDDEDESESSAVDDDSESDRYFSIFDFQQLKAEPSLSIDEPISLKLQGNLFVKKVPKKIVFGRGGLIIGISSEFSLEIFKFPDFSRIKTRNFDTSLLSFTFSKDESQYFCCFFNKIIVFNLLDSTMNRAYCIEKCQKIVMHDTSTRFCTFHNDGRIKAFKLPQNIEIASFNIEKSEVMVDATFSLDGRYIVVGFKSGKISLFDIDQKKLIKTVNASKVQINSMCFDSVNNYLFSAGDEKIFKKWRIDDDDLKYDMSFNCSGNVSAIGIKGKWLVSGSSDKTFSMTDIDNNKICYIVKSHSSPILCIAFASYKEMFATASKDMTVKIWTFQNSKK